MDGYLPQPIEIGLPDSHRELSSKSSTSGLEKCLFCIGNLTNL